MSDAATRYYVVTRKFFGSCRKTQQTNLAMVEKAQCSDPPSRILALHWVPIILYDISQISPVLQARSGLIIVTQRGGAREVG